MSALAPARRHGHAAALLVLLVAALRPGSAGADSAGQALLDDAALLGDLMVLADERLALMPEVAAAKWSRGVPVADPAREQAVATDAAGRGASLGLEPDAVAGYFRAQIDLARASQQRLFDAWRAQPPEPGGSPRDLARELRPELDRLTVRTLKALYLVAPLTAADGFAVRAAAAAGAQLPATRWQPADRATLLAALARVRSVQPASLARARAAGMLRIGTPGDYAPFSVAADARVTGSDVELARELADAAGLEAVFIRSSWRSLLPDLGADRFDLAVGGISVTPARRALAAFSAPVARSGKTAVGRCADAGRLGRLADIDAAGITVVFNPGGTNEAFVRARIKAARLVEHADNRTIFDEIDARRADVMFTDEIEVALAVHRHPGLCRLLSEAYEPTDKAFLMPKAADFGTLVDPWLEAETARGTPARLLERELAR